MGLFKLVGHYFHLIQQTCNWALWCSSQLNGYLYRMHRITGKYAWLTGVRKGTEQKKTQWNFFLSPMVTQGSITSQQVPRRCQDWVSLGAFIKLVNLTEKEMAHKYVPFLDYAAKAKPLFVAVSLNIELLCFVPCKSVLENEVQMP